MPTTTSLTLGQLVDIVSAHINSVEEAQNIIASSTYFLAGNILVRLFNSKEYKATTPAIFPNLSTLRKELKPYDNVKAGRHDYLNGIATGNRKTDLVVQNPMVELKSINIAITELTK